MPAAASSIGPAACSIAPPSGPGDPTATPPAHPHTHRPTPDARRARCAEHGHENLVVGYLSAVVAALGECGIAVTLHVPDRNGRTPDLLCGTLSLRRPGRGAGRGWAPTQADWHQDIGWSARLRRSAGGNLTVWRYLHAGLVPAPVVVAGFVAGLAAGVDVGMATPARFLGRRRSLITQLDHFASATPS